MKKRLLVPLLLLATLATQLAAQTFHNLRPTQTQLVRAITQDATGMLWVATERGLLSYDGYALRNFADTLYHTAGAVNCCVCNRGELLLGCERGLLTFSTTTHTFTQVSALAGRNIRAITVTDTDEWLGTDRGLYHNRQAAGTKHPLEILALAQLDGILYAGSYDGLFCFDPAADAWLPVARGEVPLVSSLAAVPGRKQLCVGTANSLMTYAPGTDSKPHIVTPMPVVKNLCFNAVGQLLIGTDNGLFVRHTDGTLHHIAHDARNDISLAGDAIWSLFADRDHNIWVGTENGLSLWPDRQSVRVIPLASITQLPAGNQICAMLHDSKQRWWLGGTHGLICAEGTDVPQSLRAWFRMNNPTHPIPHNRVHTIYEDPSTGLWVGTDGGLLHLDERDGRFRRVTLQGDKNQWIYDIRRAATGRKGHVQITTFDGCYDVMLTGAPATLVAHRTSQRGGKAMQQPPINVAGKQWTLSSPLHLSDRFVSIYYDSLTHNILLGGVDEVAVLNPRMALAPQPRRPLCVTRVEVNGTTDVPLPERQRAADTRKEPSCPHLHLSSRQNNLTVSFSDFDFSPEHTATYAFRLSRKQAEWVHLQPRQNTILLSNLQPGNYELTVCDTRQLDAEAEPTPLLLLHIHAPWYQTTWAWCLYILLALAAAMACAMGIRYRRRAEAEKRLRDAMLASAKQKARQLEQDNEQLQRQVQIQTLSAAADSRELSADEAFLLRITQLIEEHMDSTKLSTATLSQLAAIPAKQLTRRLKQLTGQTPVEFIRHKRLSKAAALLHNRHFSIAEVMYMVGFSNASYFTRCFTAEHGMTPTEYHNKHQSLTKP